MKIEYLKEPELIFGKGKSICPRDGIENFNVYDTVEKTRKQEFLIGIIGIEEDIENMKIWLNRLTHYIPSKSGGKQRGLFRSFPGFNTEQGFCAKFLYSTNYERVLSPNEIKKILKLDNFEEKVLRAVDLYVENVKFLSDLRNCDVIICIVPKSFENTIVIDKSKEETVEITAEDDEIKKLEINFRRALKAKVMPYNTPIQIVREYVLHDDNKTQDPATKAWNICTALYYKGLQTIAWKMDIDANKPRVCFVGIGFYRSRDNTTIQTSLAQIFNENGNGVILRGSPAVIDKNDKKPHLSFEHSHLLLKNALEKYKFTVGTMPARLVLHKTSNFSKDELNGFVKAMEEFAISEYDIITILETELRFFRNGLYPPVRGSLFSLSEERHILYTRGSVHQYQTYPGMYIPAPIEIRIFSNVSSVKTICQEILALTKMNWNTTQFDNKYPITISCAKKVGEIMKYLKDSDIPKESYAFYM
jgi:hypothetical protein